MNSVVSWVILAAIVVCAFVVVTIYNSLVRLRQNREQAFANVDVQLQQRFDMIPQLVEAVKAYMDHENKTLTDVIQARNDGMSAATIDDKIAADKRLTAAMGQLKVTVEAYPQLKANGNFTELQKEIADTENKLAAARRFFNTATKEYNTACEVFPNVVFAGMFGHHREAMFDVGPDRAAVTQRPQVGAIMNK